MLDSLDTLIALCVILAAASMLVTLVVQMLSALFSLRGKQLAEGLSHVLQGISPATDEQIRRLVNQLLTDPHLTGTNGLAQGTKHSLFTLFSGARKLIKAVRPEDIYASLKKLADAAPSGTPTAGPTGLLESVETPPAKRSVTFGTAEPAAHDPLLPFKQRLNAVPKVLKATFESVEADVEGKATSQAPSTPVDQIDELARTARGVMDALTPPSSKAQAVQDALFPLLQQLSSAVLDSNARDKINAQISATSQALVKEIDGVHATFDKTFQAAQDKAQELFLANIRRITIAVGMALALIFQWDAIDIYSSVSGTDSVTREALVKEASSVMKLARDNGLDDLGGGPKSTSGGLLEWIAREWNAEHTVADGWPQAPVGDNLRKLKTVEELKTQLLAGLPARTDQEVTAAFDALVKKQDPAAQTDVAKLAAAWNAAQPASEGWPQAPAGDGLKALTSPALLKDRLVARTRGAIMTVVEASVKEEISSYIKNQETLFKQVASLNGYAMIAKDFWRWEGPARPKPVGQLSCASVSALLFYPLKYYWNHLGHLPGMLIFGGLLSLGAPFWFNALKNLTDLRPALAKLLDQTGAQGSNTNPKGTPVPPP